MNKQQSGFTLIELVVVIVILGILAATALPKFVDLRDDAEVAATKGVAGAITAAFATNYGARMANSAKGVDVSGSVNVTAAAAGVMVGGIPGDYAVDPTKVDCASAGDTISVGVSRVGGASSNSAAATLVCTG